MRLIDADVLSDVFCEYLKTIPFETLIDAGRRDAIKVCIFKTKQLPTVDAEPVKHGEWVGTEYDGYADGNPVYYEWQCSVCGCVFEDDEPTYRYCPNCGAKMNLKEVE